LLAEVAVEVTQLPVQQVVAVAPEASLRTQVFKLMAIYLLVLEVVAQDLR
jgi:hypothetical protein